MKRYVLRTALYLAGASILALGIQFSILSDLGAGAYDAMNANLHRILNAYISKRITLGNVMALSMLVLFAITMIIKPRLHYFFGFVLALFISFMIDVFGRAIPSVQTLPFQVLYYLLSLLNIAFGVALIIRSKFPLTAMDNLMMILVKKTKKPVAVVKTVLDLIYALFALAFGILAGIGFGAVSIGTAIMTFTMGPLINMFLKIVKEIK